MSTTPTLAEFFGFSVKSNTETELPEIFPMPVPLGDFIKTDIVAIYTKILTDVLERIHGLKPEQAKLMWDNCVKSERSDGLITLLAKAMADKTDLYIVYDKALDVLRPANGVEQTKIREDYAASAKSSTGTFISFTSYRRTDMVKLYSSLEYCTIAALNKSLNMSAAPQFKFSDLRKSVSAVDASKVEAQAQAMAQAYLKGRPIMMDGDDEVELGTPDLSAAEKSISFIANKQGFYLGMPASYITSVQTGGLGSTGEGDARAVERGLKAYFFSIMKPTLESIFGLSGLTYKSQDFRNIDGALEVVKTLSLVDEELISRENKLKIVNQAFDLPEDAKGDAAPKTTSKTAVEGGVTQSGSAPAGSDIQKQALNGAQVSSMVEIVSAVAAGTLPRDSGVQMLMVSFQLESADAERLMGSSGKGFKPTPAPAAPKVVTA